MKKLMFAAVTAAMVGGAFAECEDPEETTVYCARVYKLNVELKTLVTKSKTAQAKCEEAESLCYLVSGTRKFGGVLASCSCDCEEAQVVADPVSYFWCTTTKKAYCDGAEIALENAVRYGAPAPESDALKAKYSAKAKKVAATVTITAENVALTGAGFGTFDYANQRLKTISGYIAGTVEAPVCEVECEEGNAAYGWSVCGDETAQVDSVPAYGTWKVVYDANASKKYATDQTYVLRMLPSYYSCEE